MSSSSSSSLPASASSSPLVAAAEAPAAASVTLIANEADLRAALAKLATAERVAVDIESNGLFKYKATLCTMQLADASPSLAAADTHVYVVDTIVTPLSALIPLLGKDGPRKIVHDVAFDARILAESGITLANVYDTSIAARMLSRTATGLASLLGTELGVVVDKKLQHHDWTERPLRSAQLHYLANDVIHLGALATKLWEEVATHGVGDEIEEETRYRLSQAILAAKSGADPRPPWVRLKNVDKSPATDLPILRRLANLREALARKIDVPPYKVLGPDILFAIAKAKPRTMADLGNIKGALSGHRARSLAPQLLEAVVKGLDEGTVPEEERVFLDRPRLSQSIAKVRRHREHRLTAFRRNEAKTRNVDEQVILPGHCLQDLADLDDASATLDEIARIPGIGAFRVLRYGEALLSTIKTPPPSEATPPTTPSLEAEESLDDENSEQP